VVVVLVVTLEVEVVLEVQDFQMELHQVVIQQALLL
jgi:hypothetical protein